MVVEGILTTQAHELSEIRRRNAYYQHCLRGAFEDQSPGPAVWTLMERDKKDEVSI